MKDRCRIYDVPGVGELRVRGSKPMSKRGLMALAALVKAAYSRMQALPADLGERQAKAIARVRARAKAGRATP